MPKRVAIYGGSFNPPAHHRGVVERVMQPACRPRIDELVVVPCGPRPDKLKNDDTDPAHRAAMCDIAFRGLKNVRLDLFDLENNVFTRQLELQERYAADGTEVWHVVGADLVKGGAKGESDIQKKWTRGAEVWENLNFIVVRREGYPLDDADLPPRCEIVGVQDGDGVDRVSGASSKIRLMIYDREPYKHLVSSEIHDYIERYNLYRGARVAKTTSLKLPSPRPFFVIDVGNPKAEALAAKYGAAGIGVDEERANCIVSVGGDGHMLRTVRQHWRRRLPFVGINAGHVGYLLNDQQLFGDLPELLADLRVHLLTQLSVEAEDLDGNVSHHYGFNDAWVRDTGQAAWLDVTVNGRVGRIIGDGALVSTPAGSTGYAWSMGAHPILVDGDEILLVGNNVCRPRGWQFMRLPKHTVIELVADGGDKRKVSGYVDGMPLGFVRRMRCTSSKIASVELAFSPQRDLAAKLSDQMFPE